MTTPKGDNIPENQCDDDSLADELDSANGGSFLSVVSDVLDTGLKVVSPNYLAMSNIKDMANGDAAKRADLMQKTGQTSFGDQVKWSLMPNTMSEKTAAGVQGALDEAAQDNTKQIDQYNKDHGM